MCMGTPSISLTIAVLLLLPINVTVHHFAEIYDGYDKKNLNLDQIVVTYFPKSLYKYYNIKVLSRKFKLMWTLYALFTLNTAPQAWIQ